MKTAALKWAATGPCHGQGGWTEKALEAKNLPGLAQAVKICFQNVILRKPQGSIDASRLTWVLLVLECVPSVIPNMTSIHPHLQRLIHGNVFATESYYRIRKYF